MNYNQILTLFIQGTTVATVILFLFRLRKKLGLGVLYACLGLFQFVQVMVFILNTVFDSKTSNFLVSPGSSVFITITLFSLLIIYIKEDAQETKKMIYAILIVNVLISLVLLAFGWNIKEAYLENSLSTPNHFIFSPRILIFGNIALLIDSLLLIIIFEYISKKTKFLYVQILITMLIVVSLDTILFSVTTFWNLENLTSIITSNLIAKNSFAFYYSILFYFYLRYLDHTDKDLVYFNIKNVFKPLSYKQKFETAVSSIKKSEEMYRLITDNSTDVICLLDLDGKYKYVSPSIKSVLGYNQSDFIDENIFNIVHIDDVKQLKENIINFKNTNNIFIFRLLHKKGFYAWIELTISPIYKNKKLTSFVSSARNISERVIANNQFKNSLKLLEKRENLLTESSKIGKIGFIEFDTITNSYSWSDYLFTIFGLEIGSKIPSQEELINYYEEESKIELKKCIKNLELNGTPFDIDLKIINAKKEELWLRTKIEPVFNEQNKVIGRRGISQDITKYKNAQLTLEKNDYSLKESSRIAKIGYWEYDIKSDCFTWSDYVYKLYGLNDKDIIPSRNKIMSFYDKVSSEKYEIATKNLLNNGVPFDLELRIINAKKEEVWVRVVVQLIYNEKNEVTGRRGIIQNITDAKKINLQLEKSNLEIKESIKLIEQKEQSLKETRIIAKVGYSKYLFKTDSFIWSDYVYKIFGLDPKNKIPERTKLLALYDDESLKKLQKATKKLDKDGIPYDLELKLTNTKKEEIWVRVVAHLIYNEKKELIGRSGVFRDITEAKNNQLKLETYLKQLETKDADLKESNRIANIGYWEYYFENDKITSSYYTYKIFGLDPNKEIPSRKELKKLYNADDLIKLTIATKKLMLDGIPYDIELKLNNFKNEEIWTRNIVQPIYDSKNKIIGRRGVIQNITAYKKTQIALENSLQLLEKKELSLKDSSKMAGIGYIEYDYTTSKYTDYSEYIYTLFGISPGEELKPEDKVLIYFDNESKQKFKKALEDVKNGLITDIELKGKNRKQEEIWIRSVSSPIYNDSKEVIKRRIVLQDIKAYKLTQQELQQSLHLLKKKDLSLQDSSKIAGVGFIEYNYLTDSYTTTEHVYNIFGFDLGTNASQKEIITFFDKESQIKYIQALQDLKEKGLNYDLELKGINKKNEEIWIRSVSSPLYNDDGTELIGRRIVIQDIRNYKNIQLELEKSKQEIQNSLDLIKNKDQALTESNRIAKIGYWEYDIINDSYSCSDYVYEVFGLDPNRKTPPRKEILKFYDQESQEKLEAATLELNTHGVPYDIELKLRNTNNEEVWTRNIVHLVFNNKNEVIARKGLVQNISAYRKAQIEIKNSLTLLEKQDYSLKESSRIAKIGFVDYNSITEKYTWSDYTYAIFGLKTTDQIPSPEKISSYFDKESQEKLKKVFYDINKKGLATDIELKGKNKNNETFWIRQVAQPVYNEHKVMVGRRALLQDITAYKTNQLQLENSFKLLEKRKFSMDEASKVAKIGYYDYNTDTDTFIWSENIYIMHGLDPNKPVPPRNVVIAMIDKESLPKVEKATQNLNQFGTPYDIEMKILNKKRNQHVWIRLVAQPVYNKNNKIVGRRGVAQDITLQKNTQIELEEKNKKINETLKLLERNEYSKNETSKVAKIGYHEYYNTTDSFYWSDYMYTLFGLELNKKIPSRSELVSLFYEKYKLKLKKATENLEAYGLPYDLELKLVNFKREVIWIRMSNQPIYNESNSKIIGRRGVAQNITLRKLIEEEHLKVKNDYIRLFENATISIWNEDLTLLYKEIDKLKKQNITNIDKYLEEKPDVLNRLLEKIKINYVNKATLKLFKASNQNEFFKNIHLSFGKGADKVFTKLIEAIWFNLDTFYSEVNYKTLKGDEFTAIVSVAIPKTLKEQKTVPVSIQSIQKIKDVELALKDSLKNLNEAQKLGHIGNWELNTITEEFTWSDEVYNLFDFNPENGLPKKEDILKKIHPDDIKFHNKKLENAIKYGNPFNIEIRFKISDISEKTIKIICEPIKDNEGKVICLKGVNQDITKQKKIQKELENKNKELKQSLELLEISEHSRNEVSKIAKIGYQDYNSITNSHKWSDYFYEILGFNPKYGIPDTSEIVKAFHNESQIKMSKAIYNLDNKGIPCDIELELINKKLGNIWLRFVGQSVFSSNNEIIGKRGIIQNITEQKIKQKKLDEQNETLFNLNNILNEAQKISKIGNWQYNKTSNSITWSNELFSIFERSRLLGPPKGYSDFLSYYTDNSKSNLDIAIQKCITQKTSFNLELNIYNTFGSLKHINIKGKVLFDGYKILGCYGTIQDITEQKQILDEIEKTQEKYRLVTENSNDLICLHDINGVLLYLSPSVKPLLGYDNLKQYDKPLYNIIHHNELENFKNHIKNTSINNKYKKPISFRAKHIDGHFVWFEALSSAAYKEGQITFFITIARDITESVLAKREIEEYQESLQKLTTEITLVEENQKKEIATNIHDHLSQALVISNMKIKELQRKPELKNIDEELHFVEDHITDALANSRRITSELSPPILYQLGIIEALYWLLENIETKHKIKCEINEDEEHIKLNEISSILLYRSIQEILNNAIKYAKATLITINILKKNQGLDIVIKDNGIGFNINKLNNFRNSNGSGFGLFTVQERIKNIKGKFKITSEINKGTSVNIYIPLKDE
ncbi:PAS domain-containing protein [Polaribacter sp. Asnod6-C07]|uniref:PAS domain-containing protein n=1 Tax=Polaribacter sp. Asnod6-C07 TaxID=3160582 RepID=UPI003862E54E